MAKKFYVVWKGHETGIFETWADAQRQVHGFLNARYKSFKTLQEAESAYAEGPKNPSKGTSTSVAPTKESLRLAAVEENTIFDVKIFCDGACDPNPGEAASGIAIYRDSELAELWYGLYNSHGTNNSAELNALYQALHFAKMDIQKGKQVQILCDSKYSIECVTNWAFKWKKKGWKRTKNGDIKNLSVIQQSHELFLDIMSKVIISHVKGHAGVQGNELADRMATYGIDCQATDLCRYTDALDIQAILKFQAG